jgi:hypothetical protein
VDAATEPEGRSIREPTRPGIGATLDVAPKAAFSDPAQARGGALRGRAAPHAMALPWLETHREGQKSLLP